jgi:fructose-1,6-bisphosphatase I
MKFSVAFCLFVVGASSVEAFSSRHFAATGRSWTLSSSSSSALYSTTEVPVMTRSQTKVPVFDEVCETTGVTLTRFMNEVAMLNPEIRELTTLFGAIDTACKAVSNLVKRSQLPSSQTLGYQGEVNVQGEDQKKLDVITNDLLKRALRFTGRLGVLASEEEDVPVSICVFDCDCV